MKANRRPPVPPILLLLVLLSVAVGPWLRTPSPVRADSPTTARVDLSQSGETVKGELKFDLRGGSLEGYADLDLATRPPALPKRQTGEGVPGRFKIRVHLKGSYVGGSYGTAKGTATISGAFADQANCSANLVGTGVFTGTVSAPLGLAEVAVQWDKLEFNGCSMASPQPFAGNLPPFVFEKTEKLIIPSVVKDTPVDSSTLVAGKSSSPLWLLWAGAGAAILGTGIFGVLLIGVVLSKRRRRPTASSGGRRQASKQSRPAAAPPPSPLPGHAPKGMTSGGLICTRCGARMGPAARFCGECGGKLSRPCPRCNSMVEAGLRFCRQCGQAMGGTPP